MGLADRVLHKNSPVHQSQFYQDIQTIVKDLSTLDSRIKILVFGSVANNQSTIDSDLDVAVIVEDDLDLKKFKQDFFSNKSKYSIPVDFVFKKKSDFTDLSSEPIVDSILNNNIEVYPSWSF